MSERALEAVRSIYEGWRVGDFRAGTDLYDPRIVMVMGREFPEAGVYHGPDGVAGYMRTFLGAWERVTIASEELVAAGDTVLAAVVQRAVGRGSGAPVVLRYFHIWSFRGKRIIRLEIVMERAEALAIAGLSE